jgi:hypothetical protein
MWTASVLICMLGAPVCDEDHAAFPVQNSGPIFRTEQACIDGANEFILHEFLESEDGQASGDGWAFDLECYYTDQRA